MQRKRDKISSRAIIDCIQFYLASFGRLIVIVQADLSPNLSVSALSGNLMFIDPDETLH